MATAFVLTMKAGPAPGLRIELQKRSLVLGRDPACDIVVDDAEVSRRHARLIAQSGGYAIEDLGSTNGTFVDGERIRTVVTLRPGASVRLGETATFIYETAVPDRVDTRDFNATPPSASQVVAARSLRAAPVEPAPIAKPMPDSAALPAEPIAQAETLPPSRVRPRRKGLRLPIFSRTWMLGCGAILLLGLCAGIAFFWYVDANYLWCDVFGGLISACR